MAVIGIHGRRHFGEADVRFGLSVRGLRGVAGISWAYLANKVMGWMHGGSHVHDYPDFVLLRRVGGRLGG